MIKRLLNVKTAIFAILIIAFLAVIPKIVGLLMLLFASFVFAAAFNPFVNNLQKRIRTRAGASFIVLSIVILVLFALILPIVIMGVKEIELLISILPQKILALYNMVVKASIFGYKVTELVPMDNLLNSSTDIAQSIVNNSINFTMSLFQTCFVLLALAMFVYYIMVDKDYLKAKFLEFFPPNIKEKADSILHDITTKVGNYIRAQLLSMIAVGVMVAVVCAILGIDYPVLLGLISGICEIIPVLGPSIAVAVIVMIAFPLGWIKIVIAIALFLAVQQISNYMIRPFLFGKFMSLHPITILVALFVSEQFLGVWGVILSPAIAATVCVLFDELYLQPINAKELENIGENNE